jgi:hypothetical protein
VFPWSISLDPICVIARNWGKDRSLRDSSILWTTILSRRMERCELRHFIANYQEKMSKWRGIAWW